MSSKSNRLAKVVMILVSLALIGGSIWFVQTRVQPDWAGIGEWLDANTGIVVGAIVFVVLFGTIALLGGQCPKCGKQWSMRRTGATRGRSCISLGEEEFRCVHCGRTIWRSTGGSFPGGG